MVEFVTLFILYLGWLTEGIHALLHGAQERVQAEGIHACFIVDRAQGTPVSAN